VSRLGRPDPPAGAHGLAEGVGQRPVAGLAPVGAARGWRAAWQCPGLLTLALLSAGCAPDASAPGHGPAPGAGSVRTPAEATTAIRAPDWRARDLDGKPFALADLRGHVVVLNIWATWCAPCLREMPKLQALADDYAAQGLRVVGVSIDRGSALPQVRSFIEELEIGFTILADPDQAVMTAFGALGVPETFLVDREGRLVHRWTGEFDPGAAAERARIDAVL
jgi:peroxiredoxin